MDKTEQQYVTTLESQVRMMRRTLEEIERRVDQHMHWHCPQSFALRTVSEHARTAIALTSPVEKEIEHGEPSNLE